MVGTWYKSQSIDGGPVGDQIAGGDNNNLLQLITKHQIITGDTVFTKAWVETDTDGDLFILIADDEIDGISITWFQSAGTDDYASDLTGNEPLFGVSTVVSSSGKDVIVNGDLTIWRQGDYFSLGNYIYNIDAVADNGDGTVTITAKSDIVGTGNAGEYIAGVIYLSVTAGTQYPFWMKTYISPGANREADTDYYSIYLEGLY